MKDYYREVGNLSQQERWHIWQQSLKEPMGSYARMRDKAESQRFSFLGNNMEIKGQ